MILKVKTILHAAISFVIPLHLPSYIIGRDTVVAIVHRTRNMIEVLGSIPGKAVNTQTHQPHNTLYFRLVGTSFDLGLWIRA